MSASVEIVHALPGRVRFQIPEIRRNPAAAQYITDLLLAKAGIKSVSANTISTSVIVRYDPAEAGTFIPEQYLKGLDLRKVGDAVSISASSRSNGNRHGANSWVDRISGRWVPLAMASAALVVSLLFGGSATLPVYALVAASAAPIYRRATMSLVHERRFGVDFLDALSVTIMGLQGSLPTCAFMSWLISVGEHIRKETARRSEMAITDLLSFNGETVLIMQGNKRVRIPIDILSKGDHVIIGAGDGVPADGTVLCGWSAVDQKCLTGESGLFEKSQGEMVFAGSTVVDGELEVLVTATGGYTRAGKIVEMLRQAPVHDTKIEDYAARFADRLVLPTLASAGLIFALTRNIGRTLAMLIVDFGTGVRVAAPTTFLAFMTYAAKKSIVIKSGRAMEKLASVDTVVFDKTGTLTSGIPKVCRIVPLRGKYTEKGIIRLAAGAESAVNHPVAHALTTKASELGVRLPAHVELRLRVGLGVCSMVEGKRVLVGSERLMSSEKIDMSILHVRPEAATRGDESRLYLAVNGKLVGMVTYTDSIRSESESMIRELRALGVSDIIIATGDRHAVAQVTSRKLGIERVISEVFPEEKWKLIDELRKQGRVVAVVGDGINDSLALAHADVAVAPMGGTDTAKEAADILLMEDDLHLFVEAIRIAKSAMRLVSQSYKLVAYPNAAAMGLAAAGLLGPAGATFLNNGSTVAAGLNSLKPLIGPSYCHGSRTVAEVRVGATGEDKCPAVPIP